MPPRRPGAGPVTSLPCSLEPVLRAGLVAALPRRLEPVLRAGLMTALPRCLKSVLRAGLITSLPSRLEPVLRAGLEPTLLRRLLTALPRGSINARAGGSGGADSDRILRFRGLFLLRQYFGERIGFGRCASCRLYAGQLRSAIVAKLIRIWILIVASRTDFHTVSPSFNSRLAKRAAVPRAGCLKGNIYLSARVCII